MAPVLAGIGRDQDRLWPVPKAPGGAPPTR